MRGPQLLLLWVKDSRLEFVAAEREASSHKQTKVNRQWDWQKLFQDTSSVLVSASGFGSLWAHSDFPNLSFTGQCSSDLFQSTHNVIVKTEQTGE